MYIIHYQPNTYIHTYIHTHICWGRIQNWQPILKPSRWFRSRLDGLRVVQTASKPSVRTNVVTKPSSKWAAKPSLPVENMESADPSHSDPLKGYRRRRRYKYAASELDFATPTAVSQCLQEPCYISVIHILYIHTYIPTYIHTHTYIHTQCHTYTHIHTVTYICTTDKHTHVYKYSVLLCACMYIPLHARAHLTL